MFEKLLNILERNLIVAAGCLIILRVGYLYINGLDLIGDESYYWDWSRKLDWCYYSKPPMVAWIIALFTYLGGDNTEIVRLPAVALGTLTLGYLYATTKQAVSAKAGVLAVLLLLAMPFNVLANFVMTIDAPLNCFWMISLFYLRQALFGSSKMAWFWAGLATGAALLSKQAALFIPLMLIVYLVLDFSRHRYFKFEFLLYLLPIVLSLIPIVLWNQEHDWVMLGHSKGHFGIKETATLLTRVQDAGAFLGYQMLLATPVIFITIVWVSARKIAMFSKLSPIDQFLMLMGPVLLLGIIVLSFVQKVQGNWSAPFYLSTVILLSKYFWRGHCIKPLKWGLVVGYSMVMITYLLPVAISTLGLQNTAIDPTVRFRHWQALANTAQDVRKKAIKDLPHSIVITLGHRFLASQLAFYLPDHPHVYRYENSGQIISQYEVWPGPEQELGKTAFIITEMDEKSLPVAVTTAFERFYAIGSILNPMSVNSRYNLFVGENLQTWQKPKQLVQINE